MTLDAWHRRLDEHFRLLREQRSAAFGDKAIFALEHGLDLSEVQELNKGIRTHIEKLSTHQRSRAALGHLCV